MAARRREDVGRTHAYVERRDVERSDVDVERSNVFVRKMRDVEKMDVDVGKALFVGRKKFVDVASMVRELLMERSLVGWESRIEDEWEGEDGLHSNPPPSQKTRDYEEWQ